MKISKLHIENFRLLKKVDIDLEDALSVVVGKNNTGKTSLKIILRTFLNESSPQFSLEDLNIDLYNKLNNCLINDMNQLISKASDIIESDKHSYNDVGKEFAIKLFITIDYDEFDELETFWPFFSDLSPNVKSTTIALAYYLSPENYNKLIHDIFRKRLACKEDAKKILERLNEKPIEVLRGHMGDYFDSAIFVRDSKKTTYEINEYQNFNKDAISLTNLRKLINYKYIDAERSVSNTNSNGTRKNTLSTIASSYWKMVQNDNDNSNNAQIEVLEESFLSSNEGFTSIYHDFFKDILLKVKNLSDFDQEISVESNMIVDDLLSQNTKVTYSDNGISLPEHYNGLGYMNLIEIVFDLCIQIYDFEKKIKENPSSLALLLIEEPEAHMHQKLQSIFIEKIKNELSLNNTKQIQTIITTHSAQIAAVCDINSFKYFVNKGSDEWVVVKNLSDLAIDNHTDDTVEDGDAKYNNFSFVKQYITQGRAEVFFADKIIMVEGDTERLFMPAMIKKFDKEKNNKLANQNIVVIETGAFSNKFHELINFLELKTLIITDIDYVNKDGEKCDFEEAVDTSNQSIKHFLNHLKTVNEIKTADEADRTVKDNNRILLCYQQNKNGYYPRSFEDAFINDNKDFIINNLDYLFENGAIKNKGLFSEDKSPYELAEKCIKSKTSFALACIYLEAEDDSEQWKIPNYIKEGLAWIAK